MAPPDLPISLDRASTLAHNFLRIKQRIANTPRPKSSTPRASSPTPGPTSNSPPAHDQHHESSSLPSFPLLVAVSKLKPANDILFLHGQPPFSPQTSITNTNTSDTSLTSSSDTNNLPKSPFHNHFGENYTDELISKSRILPRTIKWHFIGQLQSNKCKSLAEEVENLWCVESVDSEKKADLLEKGRRACVERLRKEKENGGKEREEEEDQMQSQHGEERRKEHRSPNNMDGDRSPSKSAGKDTRQEKLDNPHNSDPPPPTAPLSTLSLSSPPSSPPPNNPLPLPPPLHIHIQINTSSEPQKSGLLPSPPSHHAITSLYKHITSSCPHLLVTGLMTIGAIARSQSLPPGQENEDFEKLKEVRDEVCKELGLDKGKLKLSMGMSEDFESAVRCGSDEVRVGSSIFGERVRDRKEARVVEVDEG